MRLLAVLGLVLSSGLALPAGAMASPSSVVIYGEPGNGILNDEAVVFRSDVDEVFVTQLGHRLEVSAQSDNYARWFNVQLAPPRGETLSPGLYEDARRPVISEGQPGLDVSGDGAGCGSLEGRFRIREIEFEPSGALRRLWATFEQRCSSGDPWLFGEVRFGMPDSPGDPQALAAAVEWPASHPGRTAPAAPIHVFAGSASGSSFGAARLTGPQAGSFSIVGDDCSGRTVSAGDSCRVWVRYEPTSSAPAAAALRLETVGGPELQVPLDGRLMPGRTGGHFSGGPGSSIAQGRSYQYEPADALFWLYGNRTRVNAYVRGADGRSWMTTFDGSDDRGLRPGFYDNTTRGLTTRPDRSYLEVSGDGRGCNTSRGRFRIRHATYAADGWVSQFSASFVQYCDTDTEPLVGSVYYRAPLGLSTAADTPLWPSSEGLSGPPFASPRSPAERRPSRPQRSVARAPKQCSRVLGASSRALVGTGRPDLVTGTRARELFDGRGGSDRLRGGGGNDCLHGGSGRDDLRGGSGSDVLIGGPGRDRLLCGAGRDVAIATADEKLRGCERIIRPASQPQSVSIR